MKLTIINVDNAVYVDGISISNLNLSSANIPSNIHALQWLDTEGWVEYKDGTPNETITALPDWANASVSIWADVKNAAPLEPTQEEIDSKNAVEAAKASAISKLSTLGLTADEIKALVG